MSLDCLPKLLGYNMLRAHQCCWRSYASLIGENRMRPGLFSMLVLVRANPGISQIDLGRQLGVDKASIVALLDRLESSALLERRRSTRDRRCQGIHLTSAGQREINTLIGSVRRVERQLTSRFSGAELNQFLGYLQRLYCS